LRSSGSPQSVFGLFGGPGFLVVCLLIVIIAGAVAYLAIAGEQGAAGRTIISLPGAGVPPAKNAATAPSGGTTQLQSMPAAPVAKEQTLGVAIEEDLSPAELLAKYPPDPSAALPPGGETLAAWRRFGRPSTVSPQAPRVALIITGLGRDRVDAVRAITGAPPEASLSFDGGSADLAEWIAAARAYGHEAFLDLRLRPDGGASADGLALQLGPEENVRRLDAMLARAPMIAGVAIAGGDAFLADAAALQPILHRLQAVGLAVIGLPVTAPLTIAADDVIAAQATQTAIESSLHAVMALARRRGAALGMVDSSSTASLFPAWQRALIGRDEISLVPASALVEE
jgi:polysaccharide deacetylase 2 family uncharacterized protein YibQ